MDYMVFGTDYFYSAGGYDKPYRYFNLSATVYTTVFVREISFGVGKVPVICYLTVERKTNYRLFKFHLYNQYEKEFDLITFDIDITDGVPTPKLLEQYVQYTANEHLASLVSFLSGNPVKSKSGYLMPHQVSDIYFELGFIDMLSLIDSKTDCVYIFQSNSMYSHKDLDGNFNPENFFLNILNEFYKCDIIHRENMKNIMTGDDDSNNEYAYISMANELCDLLGDHSDYETFETLFESKFLYLPKLVEKDIMRPKYVC